MGKFIMKVDVPVKWKSLVTGIEYDYKVYCNHGHGGLHSAFVPGEGTVTRMDLPKHEYPYTIIHEKKFKIMTD